MITTKNMNTKHVPPAVTPVEEVKPAEKTSLEVPGKDESPDTQISTVHADIAERLKKIENFDWNVGERLICDNVNRGKIDSEGPAEISCDGEKIAYRIKNGSQETLFVNGEKWPENYQECSNPVISEDGKHVAAEVLRQNEPHQERRIVVDGTRILDQGYGSFGLPRFSPDGKKIANRVIVTPTGDYQDSSKHKSSICVDQETWKGDWDYAYYPEFSPDSEHVAAECCYVKEGKFEHSVIVDGKPWKNKFVEKPHHIETKPVFSPDGTKVSIKIVEDENKSTIATDGKLWDTWFEKCGNPVFSPDSEHVAAAIRNKDMETLCVDGKSWNQTFNKCGDPVFGPNNELAVNATLSDKETDKETIVVDEVPWENRFLKCGKPVFSPDGKSIAAAVTNPSERYRYPDNKYAVYHTIAINGKEWDMDIVERNYIHGCSDPVFSPDGKRVAVKVKFPGQNYERIVVDGRFLELPDKTIIEECTDPVFSPDSKKIMFVARKYDGKYYRIVVEI